MCLFQVGFCQHALRSFSFAPFAETVDQVLFCNKLIWILGFKKKRLKIVCFYCEPILHIASRFLQSRVSCHIYTLIPSDDCLTECHTHRARTHMPTETLWFASDSLFNSLSTWQNTGSQSCPHIPGWQIYAHTHTETHTHTTCGHSFVPQAEATQEQSGKKLFITVLSLILSLVGSPIMMNITA